MCQPGIEQGNLSSITDDGQSIVVHCSTLVPSNPNLSALSLGVDGCQWCRMYVAFHRLRIQRITPGMTIVEPMDSDVSSSEGLAFISFIEEWRNCTVKFRLPYSSKVFYERNDKVTSEMV